MLLHSDSEGCHLDIRTEEALTEHFAEERRKPGINLRSTISSTSSSFLDEISRPQDIFQRYCPISQWIRPYVAYGWRTHLLNDISAGLVIGIMLIPQAMAYAMIASLPPHYGFYSSIVPSLVYMAMGTSRHVQMGVNAPISLMVAVSISSAGADTEEQRVAAALAITALGSVVYLVMMLLRLDLVSTFIPDPVMSGFCTAMAIQIMTTNLKYAVGVPLNTDNVVSTVVDLVWKLPQVRPVSVAFFACGCVGLQGIRSLARRFCPSYTIPEQLVVLIVAGSISYAFDLHSTAGLAVVGEVPPGLRAPSLPDMSRWAELLQAAVTIAAVNFVLSAQVALSLGGLHGYKACPRQELLALSLASAIGSLFGSLPPSASFSRSALLGTLNVGSPLHNVVSGAVVFASATFLYKTVAPLPQAILASIIVMALRSMMQFTRARFYFKVSRTEFTVWVASFLVTLALGPTHGIVASLAIAIGMILRNQAKPHCCSLGRLPGTQIYRDINRFSSAVEQEGLLVFRFDASLHFANRQYFEDRLRQEFSRRRVRIRALVLDASGINTIDTSAALSLRTLLLHLQKEGIDVRVVRWKGASRDLFRRLGMNEVMSPDRIYISLADAICDASEFLDSNSLTPASSVTPSPAGRPILPPSSALPTLHLTPAAAAAVVVSAADDESRERTLKSGGCSSGEGSGEDRGDRQMEPRSNRGPWRAAAATVAAAIAPFSSVLRRRAVGDRPSNQAADTSRNGLLASDVLASQAAQDIRLSIQEPAKGTDTHSTVSAEGAAVGLSSAESSAAADRHPDSYKPPSPLRRASVTAASIATAAASAVASVAPAALLLVPPHPASPRDDSLWGDDEAHVEYGRADERAGPADRMRPSAAQESPPWTGHVWGGEASGEASSPALSSRRRCSTSEVEALTRARARPSGYPSPPRVRVGVADEGRRLRREGRDWRKGKEAEEAMWRRRNEAREPLELSAAAQLMTEVMDHDHPPASATSRGSRRSLTSRSPSRHNMGGRHGFVLDWVI